VGIFALVNSHVVYIYSYFIHYTLLPNAMLLFLTWSVSVAQYEMENKNLIGIIDLAFWYS